jgi:hypothetical protein
MFKVLLAFLLTMHGLAHITGPLGFWSSGAQAFVDRPWLFSKGITAHSALGWAFGLLWLAAAVGLIGAGLGLLLGQAWWPTLAIVAAAVSLVAILPWVQVVPPGAWGGALLDLLVVLVLLSPWAGRVVEILS